MAADLVISSCFVRNASRSNEQLQGHVPEKEIQVATHAPCTLARNGPALRRPGDSWCCWLLLYSVVRGSQVDHGRETCTQCPTYLNPCAFRAGTVEQSLSPDRPGSNQTLVVTLKIWGTCCNATSTTGRRLSVKKLCKTEEAVTTIFKQKHFRLQCRFWVPELRKGYCGFDKQNKGERDVSMFLCRVLL